MSARLADLPAVTPDRVLQLKVDAAALKASTGMKQTAALAMIAKREGFPSWERLIARAGGAQAVRDTKHELPPTEARVRSAMRHAERLNRFGGRA